MRATKKNLSLAWMPVWVRRLDEEESGNKGIIEVGGEWLPVNGDAWYHLQYLERAGRESSQRKRAQAHIQGKLF